MSSLTQSSAWKNLQEHYTQTKDDSLRDLFSKDPDRFNKYSLSACGIFLDYSKNNINSSS